MEVFDAMQIKNECVSWIRDWFSVNGDGCNAIVGISGGKDSSIVAALCVEALGRDRVIGVLMPCGVQSDIAASRKLVQHLGIKNYTIDIKPSVSALLGGIKWCERNGVEYDGDIRISNQTRVNLPARIRMATLYAVAQSMNGRVANTCNLSEDWVGYSTRYGDSAGDFSPLGKLTVAEVKAVGTELGLPASLIDKVPSDGLCGKTDEENLGFSYASLDTYIREGKASIRNKLIIDKMHLKNKFKLLPMPTYDPDMPIKALEG